MGFIINCLSAQMHIDPVFHGCWGAEGVAGMFSLKNTCMRFKRLVSNMIWNVA